MLDLTFGEQVKIVLSRKNMTIKDLAEEIEERTGKKMSRQNLTQRLGRDNFQEQDMRMIAGILGCPFRLDILEEAVDPVPDSPRRREVAMEEPEEEQKEFSLERDITIGELVDINQQLDELETEEPEEEEPETEEPPVEELLEEMEEIEREAREQRRERALREERLEQEHQARGWKGYLQRIKHKDGDAKAPEVTAEEEPEEEPEEAVEETGAEEAAAETEETKTEPVLEEDSAAEEEEDLVRGDVNPYTGREYKSNSVRMHPKRIGYVQVYDRGEHKWTDMTEWAFLGYQERKKALLGKDYEPPIYLD